MRPREKGGTKVTMTELHEAAASLRFFGAELDPDEISQRLGTQPSVGVRKDGIHFTPRGTEIIAPTGKWILKSERCSPGDLEKQISELLAPLTEDLDVWRDLSARHAGHIFAGLFIASFNEGMSLGAQTLHALGSRGLTLDLDIYNSDDSEGE